MVGSHRFEHDQQGVSRKIDHIPAKRINTVDQFAHIAAENRRQFVQPIFSDAKLSREPGKARDVAEEYNAVELICVRFKTVLDLIGDTF